MTMGELAELQTRDYIITRERYGVNGAFDVRASDNASLIFRGHLQQVPRLRGQQPPANIRSATHASSAC